MRYDYPEWLAAQGYNENTCNTQAHHIRQIEKYYGDLSDRLEKGELAALIEEFTYTREDERAARPNPTKVDFNGNNYTRLQSLKGAIKRYSRFLEGWERPDEDTEGDPSNEPAENTKQRLALERDMQTALRENILMLEAGLTIIDDGAERSVSSGFIDITCQDDGGSLVVVELKAGKTDARVVGQTLGYMGDLISEGDGENVRGIIVAHDFDKRTISAARAIPNLRLVSYSIKFTFETLS